MNTVPILPMRIVAVFLAVVTLCAACTSRSSNTARSPAAVLEAVTHAHDAYVSAINSNKADVWAASLTDDVEYMVPNRAVLVGKPAVGAWVAEYLDEGRTHWTKAVQNFVVSGDWAFGRYAFTASDEAAIRYPDVDGGGTSNDSGWGLIVYHHDADGQWRVARDAWGSDRAAK